MKIYDPRSDSRQFQLEDGSLFDVSKSGHIFFETDVYGIYTDSKTIKYLLELFLLVAPVRQLGMRVGECHFAPPPWLEDATMENTILGGFVAEKHVSDAIDLFDTEANYGLWNFYGVTEKCDARSLSVMPEALRQCSAYRFFIEVDLDGMIMGYFKPNENLSLSIASLKSGFPAPSGGNLTYWLMINEHTHKMLEPLSSREKRVMIVEMEGGDIFTLKNIYPIDTSIYDKLGGWSAEVVLMVTDPANKFHRPGNGLDFYEENVVKITDKESNDVIVDLQ